MMTIKIVVEIFLLIGLAQSNAYRASTTLVSPNERIEVSRSLNTYEPTEGDNYDIIALLNSTTTNQTGINLYYHIAPRSHEFEVLDYSCSHSSDGLIPQLSPLVDTSDNNAEMKELSILLPTTDLITIEDSNLFEYTDGKGYIHFCAKLTLQGYGQDINFHETVYSIDLSRSFGSAATSFDAARADAASLALDLSYSAMIRTYQCDPHNEYQEILEPDPLTQGSMLTICITSLDVDYNVDGMIDLSLSQGNDTVVFNAISNNITQYDSLVQQGCYATNLCYANVMVISSFFAEEDVADITASGNAILFFKYGDYNANRRRLLESNDYRVRTGVFETKFRLHRNSIPGFKPIAEISTENLIPRDIHDYAVYAVSSVGLITLIKLLLTST